MVSVKKSVYCLLALVLLVISMDVEPRTEQMPQKEFAQEAPEKISINYVDEDILDIINDLSAKKDVNVIVPTGASALKVKVNFKLPYKETIDGAWDLLLTFLDMAGYAMLPKNGMYIITKKTKEVFDAKHARQPARLFIDTPPEQLDATDERITYLYYFTNIKVSEGGDGHIAEVAKKILPDQTFYKLDASNNSILLNGKSFDIKAFMELISQFDHIGYKEQIEFIELRYTSADNVARMFNDQILKTTQPKTSLARLRSDTKKPSEDSYFPESIKIIPYERRNSLVVLGRLQAIERVRDFIYKYIDVELESGQSILHVYKLQYLEAASFAKVLENIVKQGGATGGTGQSKGTSAGGIEKFFKDVIIIPDKPSVQPKPNEMQYAGSNKLIIAARNDDWIRIKELIEKLDRPQPQVIIEVLIADLTLNDIRRLGAQFRNPAGIPFPGQTSMQAAHLVNPVIQQDFSGGSASSHTDATSLATDLIEQGIQNATGGDPSALTPASFTQNVLGASAGSAVLQMADDDGKTWSILKILNSFSYVKVLSHPHVVVTNNHKAKISGGQERKVQDQANPGGSGTTVQRKDIKATLDVEITPRISSNNEVVLNLNIDINEFSSADAADGNRNIRKLTTSAYLKSGDVLALGGLVKTNMQDESTRTPILAHVPILGWLFKNRQENEDQTSLAVFITPTIIHPKLRSGIDDYTNMYTQIAKNHSQKEELFHGLKDPITRWFFGGEVESGKAVDEFMTHLQDEEYDDEAIKDTSVSEIDTPHAVVVDDRVQRVKQLLADNESAEIKKSSPLISHARAAVPVPEIPAPEPICVSNVQEVDADDRVLTRSEMLKALLKDADAPVVSSAA